MKKIILMFAGIFLVSWMSGQELQIHYDFRHSVDPGINEKNFPMINFKYFKSLDTIGTGSFLIEVQSFLNGNKSNIGQTFFQVSQSLKFWKPKVYVSLNYSGGLGIAPPSYGYFISNSYGIGLGHPVIFPKTWINFSLMYRYSATIKPSHDPQFNFYIGGALLNYKLFYSSSIVSWAPNKDIGLPSTLGLKGKKNSFYGDPQIWFVLNKFMQVGTRTSLYYHVLNNSNSIQAYPTLGLKLIY